jgi:hypothetical protein
MDTIALLQACFYPKPAGAINDYGHDRMVVGFTTTG